MALEAEYPNTVAPGLAVTALGCIILWWMIMVGTWARDGEKKTKGYTEAVAMIASTYMTLSG